MSLKPQAPQDGCIRILESCITLFSQSGFSGVSMRDVSKQVGMTTAALYYHFNNKEALYLATVEHAIKTRLSDVMNVELQTADPWERLEQWVTLLCVKLANDCELQRLMQWVLLDTDDERSKQLVEGVFQPFYDIAKQLLHQINPQLDSFHSTLALFSLAVFPFESTHVMRFLEGYVSAKEQPEVLARFIVQLFKNGLAAY